MNDLLTSIIRTVVPLVVGVVVTQLARLGVKIDEATVASFVTALISGLYYAVVRALEVSKGGHWGWLLGASRAPRYR